MIEDTLRFFHAPGNVFEIAVFSQAQYGPWEGRAGGRGENVACGWFDDVDKAAMAAKAADAGWTDNKGRRWTASAVYFTINPCDPGLLGRANNRLVGGVSRTSDRDTAAITGLFIDFDYRRPSGVSATDGEKKAAIARAKAVRLWLEERFWPPALLADSGNGAHICYRLERMENNADNRRLVKEFYELMSWRHSGDGVELDRSVCNPSRLDKLYGTWARKGENLSERPHRRSGLVYQPAVVVPVGREALEDVVAELEAERRGADAAARAEDDKPLWETGEEDAGPLDVLAYLDGNDVSHLEPRAWENGSVIYPLEACMFDPSHTENEAAVIQLADGKLLYQCFHNSCKSRTWKDFRREVSGARLLTEWRQEARRMAVSFPYKNKDGKPYNRIANLNALLEAHGISVRYNEMTRRVDYRLPREKWAAAERVGDLTVGLLTDLCIAHNMATGKVFDWLQILSEENTYHPVREWIESKEWDGLTRFEDLVRTVVPAEGFEDLWRIYLRKWLISAVAALYRKDFSCRGVLVLAQGQQNTGKTRWFLRLAPSFLGEPVLTGVSIDPAQKDDLMKISRAWITELGELDATFRKSDIAKLKAFITNKSDAFRPPYGRDVQVWRRQTVMSATVNDLRFLVDETGNTRWWCVEIDGINAEHEIDMQQLWAEVQTWLDAGETWFLGKTEEALQEAGNEGLTAVNPILDKIRSRYDFGAPRETWTRIATATEILEELGWSQPTKALATQCGNLLSRLGLRKKKTRERRFYFMPPTCNRFREDDGDEASKPRLH